MTGETGFGIWLTGMPASGKSSITRVAARRLRKRGFPVVVLESDVLRKILTPEPDYSEKERDRFYGQLAALGKLMTESGVNVIFDATANRRAYRDRARSIIPKFMEVYVICPLAVCIERDPKGIYGRGMAEKTSTVPGLQVPYEPPVSPELTVDGRTEPDANADLVLNKVKQLMHI